MKRKVHENQCGLFVDPTSKIMLKALKSTYQPLKKNETEREKASLRENRGASTCNDDHKGKQ